MTTKFDHILAKSIKNGGTTLIDHLEDVALAAEKFADYLGEDTALVRKAAILHDIGKASTIFQKRLVKNDYFQKPFRHELASLFFISFLAENERDVVIEMIVAHHKSIMKWDENASGLGILDLAEDGDDADYAFNLHIKEWDEWKADAIEILAHLGFNTHPLSINEVKTNYDYSVAFCKEKYEQNGWSKWKGLLVGSDQFASYFIEKTENALLYSFVSPDISFYDRQSDLYPLSKASARSDRPHTLVTAPTGAGKTDFLIRRCRGRFFYTLPFQASINAMYARVKADLQKEGKNPNLDIRLMHAASRVVIEKDKIEEKSLQDKFGSSVKILTPHQLAAVAFGTRGFEMILLDIKGCDVILDEIHTYTDISKAIVLKIVEVLHHVGCRLHIGTATMPTKLYNQILHILGKDKVHEVKLTADVLDNFDRHIVHKTFDDALPLIEAAKARKEKILIVFNQVKRAQIFYQLMEIAHPEFAKMLIHSRFRRKDRKTLETDLTHIFNENTEGCLVVSTQVVEVSLDISFDVMFTECAPLDALIQRFGRINRKRTPDTIRKFKPVYVVEPPTDKEALPYEADILKRSYDALSDNQLLKERDLQGKIDTVFTDFENIDIDDAAIFKNGQFIIRTLTHRPKSVLLELLDIDSVTCIKESDVKDYERLDADDKIGLEIPVNFKTIAYRKLNKVRTTGSRPFIVPDVAYSETIGLEMDKVTPDK